MEIIRGKIPSAKKVVVYGPEGIGKSTFVSRFPNPLFIDTEGSTKDMDVARLEAPGSWQMLNEQVRYIKGHPELCHTLVIDTADWAEMLCIRHICDKAQKNSIEEFGYGKGYTYIQEEFGKLLNLLEDVIQAGVHVAITAHAKMRKFEQPDEMGAYDRWEMKLTKQVAPMVKEWADMVLFCNYKTMVVNVDGQGAQKGKNKAQGGKRVMFTTHHPCWDAKNRYNLPDEVPFDYSSISHIIERFSDNEQESKDSPAENSLEKLNTGIQEKMDFTPQILSEVSKSQEKIKKEIENKEPVEATAGNVDNVTIDLRIPKKLRELMIANQVDEWDIQNVVAARGYFPSDMLIADYPEDFVSGVLVAAWDQVYAMVKEMKQADALVFN